MKVRILKTAAGPEGTFNAGSICEGPPELFAGLDVEVLEAPAEVVEAAEAVPDVETAAAAPVHVSRPAAKRGARR